MCAIDQPSQLQSMLPSRDQQEEQQAAGLDLSLCGSCICLLSGNTISLSSIISGSVLHGQALIFVSIQTLLYSSQ